MSVKFDEKSAQRIASTVKRVEGTPLDRRNGQHDRGKPGPVAQVFKVTAATQDGSNYRWTYTGYRQAWGGAFSWSDVGPKVTLFNLVEADNGSSGTVSGITIGDDGTVNTTGILPFPAGYRTMAWITYKADGTGAYVFEHPNDPVATCSV
jgi:hypothetical protein